MSFTDIIPQFPPAYVKDNGRTIDWGASGLIAYATGCCVHLSYADNDKLKRVCSIEVAPYPVTCIAMHPTKRLMAVGDTHGRTFLWELDGRRFIASVKTKDTSDRVCAMAWKNDVLIILYSSGHLSGFVFAQGHGTELLRHFDQLWDIVIENKFTHFTLDPHSQQYILLSSNTNMLSIYKIGDERKKPTTFFETIELSSEKPIQDAQWSLHLPGYIFLVLTDEILFFHMESRSLMPIIFQKTTSSSYSFLVQFQSDHTRLITFHRNGAITVFEAKQSFDYQVKYDYQPKHILGTIISAVNSPLRDDYVAIYYSNMGIGIMDINKTKVISIDPIFPSRAISFDCDGTGFVYGTENGYVVVGNIFDPNDLQRYTVGQNKVTYVSFNASQRRVYWQTSDILGVIDLVSKRIQKYTSRVGSAIKCFGSHGGALIVQRDTRALGVFINDKERPLILQADMHDVAIDELNSNSTSGRFAVLMKNNDIRFYQYGFRGIQEEPFGLKPRGVDSAPNSFALKDTDFVTGFNSGLVLFYNSKTKAVRRVICDFSNLRKLNFQNNSLFGLGHNCSLFEITPKNEVRVCPYQVFDYCLVNDEVLLARMDDDMTRFIRISDWKPVHYLSNILPPPSEDTIIKRFIESRKNNTGLKYLSPEAQDVWAILEGKNSLRLQAVSGIGETKFYDHLTCDLLAKAGLNDRAGIKIRYMNYLFANKFDEAAELLIPDDGSDPNFIPDSLLATILLALDKSADERTITHLKMSAIALVSAGRYSDAALFFRIARLDKVAADYLLNNGETELAMRFVRGCLTGDEKKDAIFRLGVHALSKGQTKHAIPFFAGSGEFVPALENLLRLGRIVDAALILRFLTSEGLWRDLPPARKRLLPESKSTEDVAKEVEGAYASIIKRLNISE